MLPAESFTYKLRSEALGENGYQGNGQSRYDSRRPTHENEARDERRCSGQSHVELGRQRVQEHGG